jgi:hypothetical protein
VSVRVFCDIFVLISYFVGIGVLKDVITNSPPEKGLYIKVPAVILHCNIIGGASISLQFIIEDVVMVVLVVQVVVVVVKVVVVVAVVEVVVVVVVIVANKIKNRKDLTRKDIYHTSSSSSSGCCGGS